MLHFKLFLPTFRLPYASSTQIIIAFTYFMHINYVPLCGGNTGLNK